MSYFQENISHIVQHCNDNTNVDHVDHIADEKEGDGHSMVEHQGNEVLSNKRRGDHVHILYI